MAGDHGALGRWNTSGARRAGQDSKEIGAITHHVDFEIDQGFRKI
jgi:hypothetical protein